MATAHTFLILDLLAEKSTMAPDFSIPSLNTSGLKLIPRKKTRENTGIHQMGEKKSLEFKSLVDKRF